MNLYSIESMKEINDLIFKDKEIFRNRLLSSFYNNLNNYVEDLISQNQTFFRLENNPVMRSLIVGAEPYKVCYLQFLKLMKLESSLAFIRLDKNNKLDKIRQDYYNNSFFLSALKKKELVEQFYNKIKLDDVDRINLQKTLNIFSPFRLPNKNSTVILPNSNFPTCLTNLTNSNIITQVINDLSKDNNNITPIDIFYSYGIPINNMTDDLKRKIGFNKKKAASTLRELYSYQITMIDSLRVNRIKTIKNNNFSKKFSLYDKYNNNNDLMNVIISHPFNTKQGFFLPLPLEFIDTSSNNIVLKKVINTYIKLFDLPKPGFLFNSNCDIGFENYTINEYMFYLKSKGFNSYLSHYLVNYLDDIMNKGSDFAFLKIVFIGTRENGNNKHFTISFPLDLRRIRESLRITEREIYERVSMELQIQLEFYDEDEGIFELYIVDIVIEYLSLDNNNNMYGLTAYGKKLRNNDIKSIFEPCFPDLNLCLFECFFYIYHVNLYELDNENYNRKKCQAPTIDDIKKSLNLNDWFDYKLYIVNFFYSLEVIPELKESCIKGDVKSFISILISNYTIKLGIFNCFNDKMYPDDLFNDNEIINVLVWSNFHVYLTRKEYLRRYLLKRDNKKVSIYVMTPSKLQNNNNKNHIILTLDIETLTDNKGLIFGNQKPYLIQIFGGIDELNYTFWGIDNCINQFIEWFPNLFEIDKFIYIFAHNGSQFDYKFLMSELMTRYTVDITGDHNKVIKFQINNVIFLDFFLFFPTSLNNLSKSWINEEKMDFNHNLININNYNEFKEIAIEYCKKDCILLFKIVNKFLGTIFSTQFKQSIKLSSSISFFTAPQLALLIFKTIYLKCDIEGSTGQDYFIEKSAYYGGMCVVYRKNGNINNKLYCYDINSCYPASMLFKMPYKFIDQIDYIEDNNKYDDIIDYYLYEIDYQYPQNSIIVNLPTRFDDEIIYIRNGNKKWHWGNEIKTALSLGCQILKIYRIRRYEGNAIFKEYIEDIYEMRLKAKKENNTCLVDFFKLLMNSLYGKLGQKLNLQKNIVSIAELSEIVMYYNQDKVKNIKLLNDFCIEYEYEDMKEFFNQIGSLVRFSGFITAQARCILLSPFSNKIIDETNLFYTDTDSIFINKKLPDEYVSNTILGKFKLEYEINKAYFLAPKMYIYETEKGVQMKMKGIPKKHLKEEYFYNLLEEGNQKINYPSFVRYFSEIYVGEISKRIVLKGYKRKYFDNGNSIVWDNIDNFNIEKSRIIEMLKLTYPTIKKEKTERQLIQTETRKNNKTLGLEMDIMIKNNYIMTYDDFFDYYTNDYSKKDVHTTWDSLYNYNEPEKYYLFLNKTFPLFMLSRNKKKKTFASDEMVKEISLFLLEGDYCKERYYDR